MGFRAKKTSDLVSIFVQWIEVQWIWMESVLDARAAHNLGGCSIVVVQQAASNQSVTREESGIIKLRTIKKIITRCHMQTLEIRISVQNNFRDYKASATFGTH